MKNPKRRKGRERARKIRARISLGISLVALIAIIWLVTYGKEWFKSLEPHPSSQHSSTHQNK